MGFWSKLFKRRRREDDIPHAYDNKEEITVPVAAKSPDSASAISQKKNKKNSLPAKANLKCDVSVTDKANKRKKCKKSDTNSQQKVETKARNGKFEIKKTKDDRFVFNLYASNHVIVATSQIYSSSQSAINGIKSIVTNAKRAKIEDKTIKDSEVLAFPKWEIYFDKAGQYRFRLYASNGSCICHSQGYTSKSSCKNGIESIIKTADSAKVEKLYLEKSNQTT